MANDNGYFEKWLMIPNPLITQFRKAVEEWFSWLMVLRDVLVKWKEDVATHLFHQGHVELPLEAVQFLGVRLHINTSQTSPLSMASSGRGPW